MYYIKHPTEDRWWDHRTTSWIKNPVVYPTLTALLAALEEVQKVNSFPVITTNHC